MSKINLLDMAKNLPIAWKSEILGTVSGANFKVLKMDAQAYPNEVHSFDEVLLVLDGQMNLRFADEQVQVNAGEVYIVPAGVPHAVASGSFGTLIIIDQME